MPFKIIVRFECIRLWVSLFPRTLYLPNFNDFASFHLLVSKVFSIETFTSLQSSSHLNNRKYPIMNKRRTSSLYYSSDTYANTFHRNAKKFLEFFSNTFAKWMKNKTHSILLTLFDYSLFIIFFKIFDVNVTKSKFFKA